MNNFAKTAGSTVSSRLVVGAPARAATAGHGGAEASSTTVTWVLSSSRATGIRFTVGGARMDRCIVSNAASVDCVAPF